jgi:IS5 family transposase
MSSFFELGLERHIDVNSVLSKIDKLIDWDKIKIILGEVHSPLGRCGYDVLALFKCLLLQNWHSLSDLGLEEALKVRLDFMCFTGFHLGGNLPDETTICRFRNKLIEQNKYEALFSEITRQIEGQGLKVKNASVAIVDATLITANARPNSIYHENPKGELEKEHSKDADAKWLKKGNKTHFGYQAFTRCDAEGFIEQTLVTPANLSEVKHFKNMLEGLDAGVRVQADKGFFSQDNKDLLKLRGLKSGLMFKAFRNKPLTAKMKKFNKIISKTRYRIEQCFGTIKRRFRYVKASYFGTEKVHTQFLMKAMCYNLLKAVNKIQIM